VLLGENGNNMEFEEKATRLEGIEVSLYVKETNLTGGGVVKLGVGKSSEVLCLNHGTTLGEIGVTKVSPSNLRPGGEKSTRTLSNFKLQENPVDSITR
jgi:hypothetical protein